MSAENVGIGMIGDSMSCIWISYDLLILVSRNGWFTIEVVVFFSVVTLYGWSHLRSAFSLIGL